METKRLEQIRQRAVKATPGPWVQWVGTKRIFAGPATENTLTTFSTTRNGRDADFEVYVEEDGPRPAADANFIACAREDVPYLLDLVDRLRAELAAEREAQSDGHEPDDHSHPRQTSGKERQG